MRQGQLRIDKLDKIPQKEDRRILSRKEYRFRNRIGRHKNIYTKKYKNSKQIELVKKAHYGNV